MNIKQFHLFQAFKYVSPCENDTFKLGDIVTKKFEDGSTEVGIVIQTHDRLELRTDMFGNEWSSNLTLSTFDEIIQFRPNILNYISPLYVKVVGARSTELSSSFKKGFKRVHLVEYKVIGKLVVLKTTSKSKTSYMFKRQF